MKQAHAYNPNAFRHMTGPDWDTWRSLYNFVPVAVQFIDRTGFIKTPIASVTADHLRMPEFDPDFSMSFQECGIEKVKSLLDDSDRLGVPIRIMYSGGIDSSFIVTSFIEYLGVEEAARRVEILMDQESISENPWMWEKFIRPHFKVLDSDRFIGDSWSKQCILVGGECNDQIQGTDLYKDMIRWQGNQLLAQPYSEANTRGYMMYKNIRAEHADKWYSLLQANVDRAPCPIETMAEWWWWLNFSCKWAHCYYRMSYNAQNLEHIDENYLKTYFTQFYNTDNFQLWAMKDREHKHKGSYITYKWHVRELIANTIGSPEYLVKIKRPSLGGITRFRRSADAIDKDFNYCYNINPLDFYDPDNSFL